MAIKEPIKQLRGGGGNHCMTALLYVWRCGKGLIYEHRFACTMRAICTYIIMCNSFFFFLTFAASLFYCISLFPLFPFRTLIIPLFNRNGALLTATVGEAPRRTAAKRKFSGALSTKRKKKKKKEKGTAN